MLAGWYIFIMLVITTSCKKRNTIKAIAKKQYSDTSENFKLINAAKEYFNMEGKKELPIKNNNPLYNNISHNKIIKWAIWEHAYIAKSTTMGEMVVVSLQYAKKYVVKTSFSGNQKQFLEDRSHLFIYKDSLGKYNSEVVTILPDESSIIFPTNPFSGYVIRENWTGESVAINYFRNGKSFRLAPRKITVNQSASSKVDCYNLNYFICPSKPKNDLSDFDKLFNIALGCGNEVSLEKRSNNFSQNWIQHLVNDK